tara:strand:- start:2481 stop:2663 length:183 start_codon:yes stop_codon:yes gene_type:complete
MFIRNNCYIPSDLGQFTVEAPLALGFGAVDARDIICRGDPEKNEGCLRYRRTRGTERENR